MAKQGIHVVFRENEQGRLYGITYVDNLYRTVFNGSDLGKAYTAKSISDKFGKDIAQKQKTSLQSKGQTSYLRHTIKATNYLQMAMEANRQPRLRDGGSSLLDALLGRTKPDYAPQIPKKRKKRRKGIRR